MSTMDIGDVCDADFAERRVHYARQMAPDGNRVPAQLAEVMRDVDKRVAEEMIDEIHCMLLHLTKDARR